MQQILGSCGKHNISNQVFKWPRANDYNDYSHRIQIQPHEKFQYFLNSDSLTI